MAKKLILRGYRWTPSRVVVSALWGILFLVISLIINYFAGLYATTHVSNPVNDLILDHLPSLNVDGIFIYEFISGPLMWVSFFVFVVILLSYRPRRIPFVLKSFSLFIVVRSFFIILTHLAPSLEQAPLDTNSFIVNTFTFTGDLFFSGHTGLPFLMALVFWDEEILRWTFMLLSFFFGAIVLLGHFHYSIDVFAAFFITFGIYHLSTRLFKKDFHLFNSTASF